MNLYQESYRASKWHNLDLSPQMDLIQILRVKLVFVSMITN